MMKNVLFLLLSIFIFSCNSPQAQEKATNQASGAKVQPTATKASATTIATPAPKATKTAASTGKINWMTLEEAQAANSKSPKKIIVDMYTHWCGPCKMMMRSTFTDQAVIDHLNENYYAVKFNAESGDPVKFKGKDYQNPSFDPNKGKNRRNFPHQFTQAMGIRGYPTLLVFDSKLNVIQKIVGFKRAPQLMPALNALASK